MGLALPKWSPPCTELPGDEAGLTPVEVCGLVVFQSHRNEPVRFMPPKRLAPCLELSREGASAGRFSEKETLRFMRDPPCALPSLEAEKSEPPWPDPSVERSTPKRLPPRREFPRELTGDCFQSHRYELELRVM